MTNNPFDVFTTLKVNPKQWDVVRIEDVISDLRGGSPLEPSDFLDEGFPVLHKGAIKPFGQIEIPTDKKVFTHNSFVKKYQRSVVNRDHLVITLRDLVPAGPSIGLICSLNNAPKDHYILAQGVYGFLIDEKRVIPEYLVLLSNYRPYRKLMLDLSVGSTQIHVRTPIFARIKIPLPPLDEQRRIVAILNEKMAAIERARAAAEAQLKAAQVLPAAYLRQVFDSAEAEGWPIRKVSELCERIDYGYTASADFTIKEPKFLRITDIQNGSVNWDKVPGCQISSKEEQANNLTAGDIVFARTGGTVGKSFLIEKPPRAVFASYLIRLRPASKTSSEFMYHFFQSDNYWGQIRKGARGGAQPNVNAKILGEIRLPAPSLEKQKTIIKNVSIQLKEAEEVIKLLQSQLDTINALPPTLLRQAFNGEL